MLEKIDGKIVEVKTTTTEVLLPVLEKELAEREAQVAGQQIRINKLKAKIVDYKALE